MIKKKIRETEEIKDQPATETFENNDNTVTEKDINGSGTLSPEDDKKQGTDAESDKSGVPESDKIIQKERELLEKLAEMQDKYLRLSAEFDNYRRRTLKEKIEITKYAAEDVLLQVLPVMDDFERAIIDIFNLRQCITRKKSSVAIHYIFLVLFFDCYFGYE